MELWMTKSALLLCSVDIGGVFQMLFQGKEYHDQLKIHKLSIFFVLASLSSSIISKWLHEDHIRASRICGHVGLLIALVTATLLLSLPVNGIFRWLPIVACAVPLFLIFSELHEVFCSVESPNSTPCEATSVANSMETGPVLMNIDSPISENNQLSSSSTNHVELSLDPVETNLVEPQSANFKWFTWIFLVFRSISVLYWLRHLPLRGCRAVVEDSSNHVSPNTNQQSPATDIEVAGSLTAASGLCLGEGTRKEYQI